MSYPCPACFVDMDMHNEGDIFICWHGLAAKYAAEKALRWKRRQLNRGNPRATRNQCIDALRKIQELSRCASGGPVPIQALNRIGAIADRVLRVSADTEHKAFLKEIRQAPECNSGRGE